jgi:hypothetical protein
VAPQPEGPNREAPRVHHSYRRCSSGDLQQRRGVTSANTLLATTEKVIE